MNFCPICGGSTEKSDIHQGGVPFYIRCASGCDYSEIYHGMGDSFVSIEGENFSLYQYEDYTEQEVARFDQKMKSLGWRRGGENGWERGE